MDGRENRIFNKYLRLNQRHDVFIRQQQQSPLSKTTIGNGYMIKIPMPFNPIKPTDIPLDKFLQLKNKDK